MNEYMKWHDAEKARRTRAGRRHDDGPVPPEVAGRLVRERTLTAYIILMMGAGALIAAAIDRIVP